MRYFFQKQNKTKQKKKQTKQKNPKNKTKQKPKQNQFHKNDSNKLKT